MLVFTYSPPKIRDKIQFTANLPTDRYYKQLPTEDTTEEEDLCDKLILSEILGVVKVTMWDPLGASRDGTDTQFLNHNHPHSYPFEKFEVISGSTAQT